MQPKGQADMVWDAEHSGELGLNKTKKVDVFHVPAASVWNCGMLPNGQLWIGLIGTMTIDQ
jgi:hypothetical protein